MGLFHPDWDAVDEDDHGAARHGGDALQVEAAVDDSEQGAGELGQLGRRARQCGVGCGGWGSTRRNGEEA